jgi:NlpC/P60 family putative phage cell wall peptidase
MTDRLEVVAEARKWIGTPFAHQGRLKGVGTDCGGLVGGVAVALGLLPVGWWREVFDPRFGGYGRMPAHGLMQRVCESLMSAIPTSQAQPGDVLMMRFADDPQHLAILTDYRHGGDSVVHALSRVGSVCEHRLTSAWRVRCAGAYSMPGVV